MKKRNKILSVILACFLVCASVPGVFAEYVEYTQNTVTGDDGNTYYYFTNGSQYVREGAQSNEYLNVWMDNAYFFMLTEPTQKFYFQQPLRLQCAYRLSGSSTCFNEIVYYTGQDLVGTVDDFSIGTNSTATLVSDNGLNTSWGVNSALDIKDSAQKEVDNAISNGSYVEGTIPWGYEFEVSFLSVSGNTNYYWLGTSSFETSEGFEKSFYYALSWYDEVDDRDQDSITDRDNVTNQAIIENKIVVTDVRELIAEVEKIKEIINNPDGYTDEQIEQYQKYIDSIPEGMLEGTTYYTQEQVDTVYDYVTGESEGFADTEEYMYYRLKALDIISKDADGNYANTDVYTSDSLSDFETQFKAIDIGAYFPYPVSKQNEVDEATQNLKIMFNNLVGANTQTQTSDGTTTDTVWDSAVDKSSDDTVNSKLKASLTNTSYKFVQVNDSQSFVFSQLLYAEAQDVSWYSTSKPTVTSFIFDEVACDNTTNCSLNEETSITNNTTEFINHLNSSNKTTTDGITNYVGWFYNSRSGDYDKSFNITDGVINSTEITADTEVFGSTTYHYYYADANIQFTGNERETDGNGNRISRESEIDLSFYWKLTSTLDGTEYHAHIPVEILVTDVRPLIDIYDELYKFSNFSSETENRANYTTESVEAVKTALASVPTDMVYGTSYYTQEEVNSYYNALVTAKNSLESTSKADYTALNEAIKNAESILNSTETVYTDSSKAELEKVYNSAIELDKNLPVSEQTIVDEIATELEAAISGIKVKADYTAFDEAVKNAEATLNNSDITYTSSTKQALENALNLKETVSRDLSTDEQAEIDSVTNTITEAIANLTEAADTSTLKEAKEKADEIVKNGNEGGRYDENDWNSFIESVTKAEEDIGSNIDDVPKSEQEKVDEVTESLNNAITEIYNKRYIFIEFKDESNGLFAAHSVKYKDGLNFNDLAEIPSMPESTSFKKYIGWYYSDGTKMELTDAITEDVELFCVEEEIKLVVKSESEAFIDEEKDFFKGLECGTTIELLLEAMENDLDYVTVKDKNGNKVEKNEVIATGMTIELVSKTDRTVKNQVVTIVVEGDINGDGFVNDDDFNKSVDMCLKNTSYSEVEKAYFDANDIDDDGVLDALDLFFISNMRYGNY